MDTKENVEENAGASMEGAEGPGADRLVVEGDGGHPQA